MAITRLGGANAITGTLPAANINDTSIGNITALPAGVGGKVLQVVSNYDATTSTSSASFVDIFGSDLSITLSSTSNKVLIIANAGLGRSSNSGGTADCQVELRVVNTTTGSDVAPESNATRVRAQSVNDINGTLNVTVIDDATFSTTTQTYNVQFKRGGGNDAVFADNLQVLIIEIAG
jgi:hypothetical protein